jgi:archaemetzincin
MGFQGRRDAPQAEAEGAGGNRLAPTVIAIVPVGGVPAGILHALAPAIEARFPGRAARIAARGLPAPDDAYEAARRQYRSDPIVDQLQSVAGGAERVLGVTDVDLFTPGLNFVFGQARPGGPALMSLARLRPEFWGEAPDAGRLVERAIKEAVHELGHTYGLGHCRDAQCVMWFSNTLAETDRKSDCFCRTHEAQLRRALGRAGAGETEP